MPKSASNKSVVLFCRARLTDRLTAIVVHLYNDNMKMMKFIETHKLKDMVSIMEYIFPEQNIYDIIIDISCILLDNYKDRAKAYECVIDKYPF